MFVNKKTHFASHQELQCLVKNESKRIKVKKKNCFYIVKFKFLSEKLLLQVFVNHT